MARVLLPAPAGPALVSDVLMKANGLRAQARWRDAERAYRQLAELAPGSDDAYVAVVAAAALRLEHLDDAPGALQLYRKALRARSAGALAEEARWGIAEAYRVAGHTSQEAEALREFIGAHPTSLMRASAEARLDRLGGGASR